MAHYLKDKTKVLHIRIGEDDREKIKKIREMYGCSISYIVREGIDCLYKSIMKELEETEN